MRTIFPQENGDPNPNSKDSPNISGCLDDESDSDVKFPKRLRYNGKGRVLATIYKRPGSYRVYWRARMDGKPRSHFADFKTYGAAKKKGDSLVLALHKGLQSAALSPGQASDALAALQRLDRFFQATGRRLSLLAGISEYCDVLMKLGGRTIHEAIEGFLSTVVDVKRKSLAEAVEDFIKAEQPRCVAGHGQRAQLSSKYAYNRAIILRRFAGALPGQSVCELAKEHLDAFIGGLAGIKSKSKNGRPITSAKARNHYRATLRQFLDWCVRKDFLPPSHRLAGADSMRPERANTAEIAFYTPVELHALLKAADGNMRAMVAIGALAGLRTSELLRLNWEDVWRVESHIEVTAQKAKTRQRRLVEVVPALRAWLEPFREFHRGKVCDLHEITWQQHFVELCAKARYQVKGRDVPVSRKHNGLRHAFCTYHFALHANENLTAQQAGNSPSMIHTHYKGLATKKEAEAFFAVSPEQPGNVLVFAAPSP